MLVLKYSLKKKCIIKYMVKELKEERNKQKSKEIKEYAVGVQLPRWSVASKGVGPYWKAQCYGYGEFSREV